MNVKSLHKSYRQPNLHTPSALPPIHLKMSPLLAACHISYKMFTAYVSCPCFYKKREKLSEFEETPSLSFKSNLFSIRAGARDLNEVIIKPHDKLRGKRWLSVLLPQRSIDPEGRQRENWEMLVLMPIQYIRHLPRDGAVQSTTNPLDRDVFQRLTRYCAAVCTGPRSRLTF